MSYSPSFIAGGTIYPCRGVKLDTTASEPFQVLQAGTNEFAIGISQEGTRDAPGINGSGTDAASDTEFLRVYGPGEVALLELGGTVTNGLLVKLDTDGKGVAAATTGATQQNVIGWPLEDGVSGEKIRVFIHPMKFYPALS